MTNLSDKRKRDKLNPMHEFPIINGKPYQTCSVCKRIYESNQDQLGKTSNQNICFDSETSRFVLGCFRSRFDKRCRFCKIEITSKNLGAVTNLGFVCNNLTCLATYTGDDRLFLVNKDKT